MERTFFRKSKESLPVLAICYDFDKTLSPDDMQAQGYIQDVGYDVEHFWEEANELAFENGMDQNLAYMYKMVEEAEGNIIVNEGSAGSLRRQGSPVPWGWTHGLTGFASTAKRKKVIVEHYIISSGLKEMIEGTEICQKRCV